MRRNKPGIETSPGDYLDEITQAWVEMAKWQHELGDCPEDCPECEAEREAAEWRRNILGETPDD